MQDFFHQQYVSLPECKGNLSPFQAPFLGLGFIRIRELQFFQVQQTIKNSHLQWESTSFHGISLIEFWNCFNLQHKDNHLRNHQNLHIFFSLASCQSSSLEIWRSLLCRCQVNIWVNGTKKSPSSYHLYHLYPFRTFRKVLLILVTHSHNIQNN